MSDDAARPNNSGKIRINGSGIHIPLAVILSPLMALLASFSYQTFLVPASAGNTNVVEVQELKAEVAKAAAKADDASRAVAHVESDTHKNEASIDKIEEDVGTLKANMKYIERSYADIKVEQKSINKQLTEQTAISRSQKVVLDEVLKTLQRMPTAAPAAGGD